MKQYLQLKRKQYKIQKVQRSLPIVKKKIRLWKDELDRKIMLGFVKSIPKKCNYLTDYRCADIKTKHTKMCSKKYIKFKDYKNCEKLK